MDATAARWCAGPVPPAHRPHRASRNPVRTRRESGSRASASRRKESHAPAHSGNPSCHRIASHRAASLTVTLAVLLVVSPASAATTPVQLTVRNLNFTFAATSSSPRTEAAPRAAGFSPRASSPTSGPTSRWRYSQPARPLASCSPERPSPKGTQPAAPAGIRVTSAPRGARPQRRSPLVWARTVGRSPRPCPP
jgi:hypothetical protein